MIYPVLFRGSAGGCSSPAPRQRSPLHLCPERQAAPRGSLNGFAAEPIFLDAPPPRQVTNGEFSELLPLFHRFDVRPISNYQKKGGRPRKKHHLTFFHGQNADLRRKEIVGFPGKKLFHVLPGNLIGEHCRTCFPPLSPAEISASPVTGRSVLTHSENR